MKNVRSVNLERVQGSVRPDISTFGANGNCLAFVEVVHTHPPSPRVRAVAQNLRVPIVEIMVDSQDDIERVQNSPSLSVEVQDVPCQCDKGKCQDCGQKECDRSRPPKPPLPHKAHCEDCGEAIIGRDGRTGLFYERCFPCEMSRERDAIILDKRLASKCTSSHCIGFFRNFGFYPTNCAAEHTL